MYGVVAAVVRPFSEVISNLFSVVVSVSLRVFVHAC